MKDRIKKFYSDHEAACNIVASIGILTGAVLVTKKVKGYQPISADLFTRDDGLSLIVVNRRDGKNVIFGRPPEIGS